MRFYCITFFVISLLIHQSQGCLPIFKEWFNSLFPTKNPSSTTLKPLPVSCGKSYYDPLLMRIYGGYEAAPHSWPSVVSIGYKGPNKAYTHVCGGVLISDEYVLTAAHCVVEEDIFNEIGKPIANNPEYTNLASMMRLYIGIHDRSKDINNETTFYADKIISHEFYNTISFQRNDIALIKLKTRVKFSQNVGWICLDKEVSAKNGDSLITIGWGYTEKQIDLPNKLMQVALPVIPYDLCELSLDKQTQFCAGDLKHAKDSCMGDSGGPIMKFVNGAWYLVGLVSYGYNDCRGTGVYTNSSALYNWIENKKDQLIY